MARVTVKRPRLLLILLLLMFVQGVLYLYVAFQNIPAVPLINEAGGFNPQPLVSLGLLWFSWLALGAASIVLTVALRGGRPWGWTGALVIEGAILILMLQYYFTGRSNALYYGALALAVAITFLLNQRDVRIFFHAHRHEHLETQPEEPLPDSLEH